MKHDYATSRCSMDIRPDFERLKRRNIAQNIKSMFVPFKGLPDAMECVSKDWTRTIVIEPPDLDGYFKVKAIDGE